MPSPFTIVFAIFSVLALASLVNRYLYSALFWGSLALGVGLVAAATHPKNAESCDQAMGGVGTRP